MSCLTFRLLLYVRAEKLAAKQDFALKVALLAHHGYETTLPLKECFQLLQYLLLVVRLSWLLYSLRDGHSCLVSIYPFMARTVYIFLRRHLRAVNVLAGVDRAKRTKTSEGGARFFASCVVRHASCEGTGYGQGLSFQSAAEERERDNAAARAARIVHGRPATNGESGGGNGRGRVRVIEGVWRTTLWT